MSDPLLIVPLLVPLIGALVAAVAGLPALNRRLNVSRLAWLLALALLTAFGLILSRSVAQGSGDALVWRFDWLPSLALSASLYFDHLSALFALLVTGIGTLVVVYAGYYFKNDQRPWGEWRFLAYLMLFMTAMLGLVLAGDVITLFIFWEGTSVTSFLLIAYKTKDEAARRGAFKSLFITGGGGIALLVGLLLLSHVAGSSDLATN
jgi:NADH:ubiquinone oxidoreductase subunit 5 (subunit L)/multisubunit Na+/H+ antiporter MnhA subunit